MEVGPEARRHHRLFLWKSDLELLLPPLSIYGLPLGQETHPEPPPGCLGFGEVGRSGRGVHTLAPEGHNPRGGRAQLERMGTRASMT